MVVYLFAALSLLLSAAALFFLADTLFFRRFAVPRPGRIVGYESRTSKRRRFYYPVAEYEDGGRTFRLRSAVGTGRVPFCIGETVTILILDGRRATARIRQPARFFIAFILAVMGAGFLAPLMIETAHIIAAWYVPLTLLLAAAMVWGVRVWERRKELSYDAAPGEDGVIGHRPDGTFENDPAVLVPYVVPTGLRLVALSVGLALLGGAAWLYRHESAFIASAAAAQGRITALQSHRDSEGTLLYTPRVRFTPEGRRDYEFNDRISSSHPGRKVGDAVPVLYDPGDPAHAQIDRGVWNYFLPAALAVLGLFTAIVSAAGIVRRKQR